MRLPQSPTLPGLSAEVKARIVRYLLHDHQALHSIGMSSSTFAQIALPLLYQHCLISSLKTLSKEETNMQEIADMKHPSFYMKTLRISSTCPDMDTVIRNHFKDTLAKIEANQGSIEYLYFSSNLLSLAGALGSWYPRNLSIKKVTIKCPIFNFEQSMHYVGILVKFL